jgi:hypothetical protein
VLIGKVLEQQAAPGQVADQLVVGVLEEQPADLGNLRQEVAVLADRLDHRQAVRAAGRQVVGAEGRGLVHQAGTVLSGDVVGQHHEVRGLLGSADLDVVERPLVRPALQLAA